MIVLAAVSDLGMGQGVEIAVGNRTAVLCGERKVPGSQARGEIAKAALWASTPT